MSAETEAQKLADMWAAHGHERKKQARQVVAANAASGKTRHSPRKTAASAKLQDSSEPKPLSAPEHKRKVLSASAVELVDDEEDIQPTSAAPLPPMKVNEGELTNEIVKVDSLTVGRSATSAAVQELDN